MPDYYFIHTSHKLPKNETTFYTFLYSHDLSSKNV